VQTPFEDLEESFEDDLEDDEDDLEELKAQTPTPESELVKKKRKRRRRRKKPAANLGLETSQVSNPVSSNSASESVPESRPEPVYVPAPPVLKAAPVMEEGIAPWRNPPVTSESRPGFRIEKPAEQIVQLLVEVKEPMEIKQPMDYQRKQEPRQSPDANYPVANYPVTNYPATGSLVGWLVSFAEDRKGISHELRDGRFFVGREQLRETDFVINHGTVSTPQCLVVCDPVSGVTIQDLMSEKGTTLIRGSAALEKSSEQVRLENGDRIRFGEYEMLFVKLPQTR